MRVTLTAPGVASVVLGDGGPVDLVAVDWGTPEVRVAVDPQPAADGMLDSTELLGARPVTFQVHADRAAWSEIQRLRAFLSPRLRPTMLIEQAGAPDRQLIVRGQSWVDPLDTDRLVTGQQEIIAQWVAPLGVFESVELHVAAVSAAGEGSEEGRGYDLTFDRTYPPSPPLGSLVVDNAGTAHAYPVLRVFGPCEDPVLRNVTVGRELAFGGLTIPGGSYLDVDVRARTIRLNGLVSQSRYDRLVFPVSSWWTLPPGESRLMFVPGSFSAPSQMQVRWRDAWL